MASAQVALLFGSEKFGLSNEELAHCHWLLRVATATADLSMNLGQAVAVCLHELVRDPRAARQARQAEARRCRRSGTDHADASGCAWPQRLHQREDRGLV